jgi:hypothetical protein
LNKLNKNSKYFVTVCTGKYIVVVIICGLSGFNATKNNSNEQLQLKASQNKCIMIQIEDTLDYGIAQSV